MGFSSVQEACFKISDVAAHSGDLSKQEGANAFIDKIDEAAQEILKLEQKSSGTLSEKVEVIAEDLARFKVQFSKEQFVILRMSDNELLREAAKRLEVENLMDQTFPAHAPGCNVVIMRKGEVLFQHASGLADVDRQIKSDVHLPQHIGSATVEFFENGNFVFNELEGAIIRLSFIRQ